MAADTSTERLPRVAYLVSQYPGISHTFIEREILALRALGCDIPTFSVRPCPPEQLLTETMRSEAARTYVLLGGDWRTWIRAHLSLVVRNIGAWFGLLWLALRTGELTPRARVWQFFYFGEAVVLQHLLARQGIRHVHVHFANVSADVARLTVALGQRLDGPESGWYWTFTMHGSNEFEAVARYDLAAKVRSARAVACISSFCRSQLMRFVESTHWPKLHIVHTGVNQDIFHPPTEGRHGGDGAPLRLLYVGRLVAEKGLPVLAEALIDLHRRGVDFEAKLVGGGPLADELTETLSRAGIGDRVHLVGPKGQDEIPDFYRWADVFVLPSFQEGLPVVLMEAMASGAPAVTTRIAAIPELVKDGENGRTVAPGQPGELADALQQLATDPGLRHAMSLAGRDAVLAEFTTDNTARSMITFFRTVAP